MPAVIILPLGAQFICCQSISRPCLLRRETSKEVGIFGEHPRGPSAVVFFQIIQQGKAIAVTRRQSYREQGFETCDQLALRKRGEFTECAPLHVWMAPKLSLPHGSCLRCVGDGSVRQSDRHLPDGHQPGGQRRRSNLPLRQLSCRNISNRTLGSGSLPIRL
jgi:hypothetical protein